MILNSYSKPYITLKPHHFTNIKSGNLWKWKLMKKEKLIKHGTLSIWIHVHTLMINGIILKYTNVLFTYWLIGREGHDNMILGPKGADNHNGEESN